MHWDVCYGCCGIADDVDGGSDAIFEFAYLAHRALTAADDAARPERSVNDADVRRAMGVWRVMIVAIQVVVGLGAEVEGNVLFGDETGADPCAEMFVEESGDFFCGNVFSGLEKAARKDADGVAVGLDQVGHDFGELDFIFERFYPPLRIREKRAETVHVVVVDLVDVGVGHDDVWEAAQALDTMGETRWQDVEGEIGAVEEGVLR